MELETQVMIAERLCYVTQDSANGILGRSAEVGSRKWPDELA